MASFSVGQAVGTPFRILGQRPLIVLVWGVAYMVIIFGPLLLLGLMMVPGIIAAGAAGDQASPAAAMSMMGPMLAFYPVMMIASILAQAVVMGAAFRAVLEPEASRFAYLRLSTQELWLALVSLVVMFLFWILAAMIMIPIMMTTGLAAVGAQSDAGRGGAVVVGVLLLIAGGAALVWAALRLSMAFPMTFVDRTFRLFESWSLTRGNVLRLLGMFLVVVAIMIGMYLVLSFVIMLAMAGVGTSFAALEDGDLTALGGSLLVLGLIFALLFTAFTGLASLIYYAPLADAYRQLRAPEAAVFA